MRHDCAAQMLYSGPYLTARLHMYSTNTCNNYNQQILHCAHSGPVTGMSASPLLTTSTTATTSTTTATASSTAAKKTKPVSASRSIMTWSGPRGELNRYLLNPGGTVPQNCRLLFRRRMCCTLPISAAHAALQLTAVPTNEDSAQVLYATFTV
jgi:hypothetical protein